MGRFVLGLLVAAGIVWGYERYFDPGEARAAGVDSVVDVVPEGVAIGYGLVEPVELEPPVSADSLDAFIARLRAGDGLARASVFGKLATLEGEQRQRVSAALTKELRAVGSVAELLALLGPSNAFLRSEEGRQVARNALRRALAEPKPEAMRFTNRLLEACMRGPIERTEYAAHELVDAIAERHGRLVRQVVFDPRNMSRAKRYKVEAGDTLGGIASHFSRTLGVKLESGTLAVINRITNPNSLQIDQVLRIPVEPIHTVIEKDSFLMAVYLGDVMIRLYWIAHGKDGHDTPETTFIVADKIEDPDWHFDGRVIPFGSPENPLGTHFVKFRHDAFVGFGVHGTDEPESIGTRASRGCIRLAPEDIKEFFRIVPRGSEVRVR